MYNPQRTLEVFGYDLSPGQPRRSKEQIELNPAKPKDLPVIDNCPTCQVERTVNLNQSRKNKPCSKCFHATPEMQKAKRNQSKVKSEETRQKMRDNHWKTKGLEPAFKGQKHTQENIDILKQKGIDQYKDMPADEFEQHRIKSSLQNGRTLETFSGFTSSENARIRQSAEGKAWSLDVLQKANFTCQKCDVRGGKLHAHHKNGFNAFPEQRFDIENGACLCCSCHEEFHKVYGKGDNTVEQFEGWINVNA